MEDGERTHADEREIDGRFLDLLRGSAHGAAAAGGGGARRPWHGSGTQRPGGHGAAARLSRGAGGGGTGRDGRMENGGLGLSV